MQNFAKYEIKIFPKFWLFCDIFRSLETCSSIMSYTVNSVNKDGWMQDAMNIKHERQGRFIKV